MKQTLAVIETQKETADYNRGLRFLEKQVYDNHRGIAFTTDGNDLRRFEKNVAYWKGKLHEYVAVNKAILKTQNEVVEQFNLVEKKSKVCKICEGSGNIIVEDGEEYIECICQDDRWDENNQDQCVECEGKGQYIWKNMDGTLDDPKDCDTCNCTGRITDTLK